MVGISSEFVHNPTLVFVIDEAPVVPIELLGGEYWHLHRGIVPSDVSRISFLEFHICWYDPTMRDGRPVGGLEALVTIGGRLLRSIRQYFVGFDGMHGDSYLRTSLTSLCCHSIRTRWGLPACLQHS